MIAQRGQCLLLLGAGRLTTQYIARHKLAYLPLLVIMPFLYFKLAIPNKNDLRSQHLCGFLIER